MNRRQRRVFSKIGIAVSIFVLFVLGSYPAKSAYTKIVTYFTNPRIGITEERVIESNSDKTLVMATAQTVGVQLQGSVKAGSRIFWQPRYDISCASGNWLYNNCNVDKGGKAIKLADIMFQKGHRGVQFYGGSVSTKYVYEKRDPITKKVIYREVVEYCDPSKGSLESYASINLGPFSLPTILRGQELSTTRVLGEEDKDAMYADLAVDLFRDLTDTKLPVDQIENFCSTKAKDQYYAMRTINTYAGYTSASNSSVAGADAMLWLCKIYTAEDRARALEEYVESADNGKSTVALRVDIEFNGQDIPEQYHDELKKAGLHGVIPAAGTQYHGMWGWQVKDSAYARMNNLTWAADVMTSMFSTPDNVIDVVVENPILGSPTSNSPTIISPKKRQLENDKATIVDAILGGVYQMRDSVRRNDNLAMLSFDPTKIDVSTYWCDKYPDRCPLVRLKTGCSGTASAGADVRLRSIAVADNDLSRYAGVQDDEERVQTRGAKNLAEMLQSPYEPSLYEDASIDEIIVASGKGGPKCMVSAQARLDTSGGNLSPDRFEDLVAALTDDKNSTITNGILLSPVPLKYEAWVVYSIDPERLARCRALGGCKGLDKDRDLYEAEMVDGEREIPALFSFNIATAMRTLNLMGPEDLRLEKFWTDFYKALDRLEIDRVSDAMIDCTGDASPSEDDEPSSETGPDYWLCTPSKTLLPACQ